MADILLAMGERVPDYDPRMLGPIVNYLVELGYLRERPTTIPEVMSYSIGSNLIKALGYPK